ncbi:hypothetical protein PGT21_035583 [Puccinia graminis f. sp. tritici]|uniref:Uncharacterized protein n=1 Tax=Puccinia graminis f. sp. tritici TaxID=56615 RepID=A0A5B0NUQ0_PUCGR|nr:hypothetical protein PGTUg99_036915 [Puccinia graminis f. sp. tritici]KAA1091558.1 hypothetical protein PGT21_035583 [Puccinia graminis f. sp. tritici]
MAHAIYPHRTPGIPSKSPWRNCYPLAPGTRIHDTSHAVAGLHLLIRYNPRFDLERNTTFFLLEIDRADQPSNESTLALNRLTGRALRILQTLNGHKQRKRSTEQGRREFTNWMRRKKVI